jgi:hypothetical protein
MSSNKHVYKCKNVFREKILIHGQRYLFHVSRPIHNECRTSTFRATFENIVIGPVEETLVVKNEDEFTHRTFMPFHWITNIETLADIVSGQSVLPDDVLLEIDKFL